MVFLCCGLGSGVLCKRRHLFAVVVQEKLIAAEDQVADLTREIERLRLEKVHACTCQIWAAAHYAATAMGLSAVGISCQNNARRQDCIHSLSSSNAWKSSRLMALGSCHTGRSSAAAGSSSGTCCCVDDCSLSGNFPRQNFYKDALCFWNILYHAKQACFLMKVC